MRTNIDIDDDLMEEAQRLAGPKTKKALVEEGLQALIRQKRRKKILDLEGKIDWVGDLDKLREGRFFDDSGR
jgi:Arc/MetJ family transcription regulator